MLPGNETITLASENCINVTNHYPLVLKQTSVFYSPILLVTSLIGEWERVVTTSLFNST